MRELVTNAPSKAFSITPSSSISHPNIPPSLPPSLPSIASVITCDEADGHISYHEDKADCTRYFMCEGERKHHMPCPVNLVFNAANAVADGGIVEICTRDADGGGVIIAVEDNGQGIPEEQLKNIFDPFFTGNPHRGTGLGLSVSYGLVRRYDGNITVTSVVGQGSRFEVWLPQRSAVRSSGRDGSQAVTEEKSRDRQYV